MSRPLPTRMSVLNPLQEGDGVSSDEPWTVKRIVDWTTAHLKQHGSETPRLDSEILLAHARGCTRIEIYTHFDDIPTEAQRSTMRELVSRRAQHEPVAYLVGHREFFGLDFRVTSDVLVPRPETETLVVEALERAEPFENPRILDIGTGSGCLAVSIAVNHSNASITATDVSEQALSIARENAQAHGVIDRMRLLKGDLFGPLESSDQFELIVSNPPYIADGERDQLPADVSLHEPHVALFAGADGLDVIRRLIERAPKHLVDRGHLLLEISPEQAGAVGECLSASASFADIKTIKDLSDHARVLAARRK